MVDVKGVANPLFLREEELRQAIEMLFFAYRDFTGGPDEMLAEIGLGRAHHRVIYFVGRNPGITVSELLRILRITKQSLSRVLSHLVEEAYITQTPGEKDRRQRLLTLTQKGVELERRLTADQRERIADAFRKAGAEAVQGFKLVLHGIIDEQDRAQFDVSGGPAHLPTARVAGKIDGAKTDGAKIVGAKIAGAKAAGGKIAGGNR
jgi:DNA-binding MarR family transcriptional regulator